MTEAGKILQRIVKPVAGCTEPAAIALASSVACGVARGRIVGWKDGRPLLRERAWGRGGNFEIELLKIRSSKSIFKNAMAVGIPSAEGAVGVHIAAAMGVFLPAAEGLNLLKKANRRILYLARQLIKRGRLVVELDEGREEIFIEAVVICKVSRQRHVGEAVISGAHDGVRLMRSDGRQIFSSGEVEDASMSDIAVLQKGDVSSIVRLAESMNEGEKKFMLEGARMNRRAGRLGLRKRLGIAVGATLKRMVSDGIMSDDLMAKVKIETASAADARMSGLEIEVISSSGSGNQGIMATVPVAIVGEHFRIDDGRVSTAIAISHLITASLTCQIGFLSALCGCVVKAGIGAAAALAYLLGGNEDVMFGAICNMAGNIVGEICDGAKPGCAMKLSTSSGAALESAFMSRMGTTIPWTNGIVGRNFQEISTNLLMISSTMKRVDAEIIKIMEKKAHMI